MNNSELDISILKNCIDSLKNCTKDYKDVADKTMQEYIADACVKRFEYTVETSWKIMKKYLKLEYGKEDKELTMNNIFRLMEGYGFIKSWEDWRNYYDRRNDTSHEYNQEKAQEIFNWIDKLVEDSSFLYEQLAKALGE
ncbi:MAG: HI0074 family nucleotidyltransferase substrate-binding subunit [Candidatus Gastranaerophilales bacterium]|nr:HI0074 family nucleotidyltransferase substrate-binding subunit [Candidatus Gastranaerophilales bacterium]